MTAARVAVLISGRGSNMEALVTAASRQAWGARFLVVSNRPGAPGLDRARELGVDTAVVDHRQYAQRADFDAALGDRLEAFDPTLVALAGFMRILGAPFLDRFADRMVNIHPSLLPRHPGLRTHERVLAAGESETGCTVHRVTAGVDAGPVLARARVPVLPGDDPGALAARVLRAEHDLYPRVVHSLLRGSLAQDFPASPAPAPRSAP